MIEEAAKPEQYRQAAIAALGQVCKKHIDEMISFNKPPPLMLSLLQAIQTILAGSYPEIALNPSTNQPAANDWNACRKMACKNSHSFLMACQAIFDKLESDSYIDARIQSAALQLKQAGLTQEKMNYCSITCANLFVWADNLIKHWEARKTQQ